MLLQASAAKEQTFWQEDLVLRRIGFAFTKHVLDATELLGTVLLRWCMVVSGTVVNGNWEQWVDVLVPTSQAKPSCCPSGQDSCSQTHPASDDVLTALLVALPPQTWSCIKDTKVLDEIENRVSTENLPPLNHHVCKNHRLKTEVVYYYGKCRKWSLKFMLPGSMKQNQADLYLETYQVLDLEMSRLREIQRWQASAASGS